MRRYRVNYIVELAGHIDIEAEDQEELEWVMKEVGKYPESDGDFYEESHDVQVELIERLVPEMVVIVYDGGWKSHDGSSIELRRYDSTSFWRYSPEHDPGYLDHKFIEKAFCILVGGDI